MKKQHILITVIMVLAAVVVPTRVFAVESGGSSGSSSGKPSNSESLAENKAAQERLKAAQREHKAQLEAAAQKAREEAKQKAEAARVEVKEKLEGERSKRCSEREAKVNQVIDNTSLRAKATLVKFQAFQKKVETFVADKQLSVPNYDALLAIANQKQVAAAAAIETTGATTFNCADQDATKVGQSVSGAINGHHKALKAYRDALKTLVEAVRAAYQATKPTTTSQEAQQ